MDKRTYQIILILMAIGLVVLITNTGGQAFIQIPKMITISGSTGAVILLMVAAIIFYISYNKSKKKVD